MATTEVTQAAGQEQVSASEIMVTAASVQVHDGETAVVGIGLPQLACVLARRTHAPRMSMVLEIGVVNMAPVDTPVGLADSRIFYKATCWTGFVDSLGMNLHRGVVDVGFIGALEVDEYGNVNTTATKGPDGKLIYFNGSAGGNDVASCAKRVVAIVRHGKRKLPKKVAYLTSPGFRDGKSRQELGLRGGGPVRVITDMAVLGFDNPERRAQVISMHPGITAEKLRDNTGFDLIIPPNVQTTPLPTKEELRLLREEIDPKRVYLRGMD
jgi:acyl CoA:acetate/3-ketoacid CoA transferase beta subunit